jgi:hypothetical protein
MIAALLARAVVRRLLVDPAGGVCAVDPTPIALHHTLDAALPQPPPPTTAYTPTAAQRRAVHAQQPCCAFPGCVRTAARCDLDHRIPWSRGGETSVGNLHPLCRHHHRLKHAGWHVVRAADGTHTWTSPSGQRYHDPDSGG